MKNSIKRMLCTAISVVMLLSMLSLSAAAKPSYTPNTTKESTGEGLVPYAEYLFYEDFAPENWKGVTITNTGDHDWNGKITVGQSGPKNFALRRNRSAGGAAIAGASVGETGYLTYTHVHKRGINLYNNDADTPTYFSGKYVTEFKFKQDTLCEMYSLFSAAAADGKTYYYVTYPQLYLSSTGELKYHDGSKFVSLGKSIIAGEWNTVKLVIDVDNEKYDIYLNGLCLATAAPFGGDGNINGATKKEWGSDETKRIERFFQIEYGYDVPSSGGGTTYYDDIKIYREPVGRNTLWANDLTGYDSDVTYNTNPLKNFAGLGNNFATGSTPNAMLNSTNDAIEFNKGGSISVRGFSSTLSDNATMEFDFSVSGHPVLKQTIAGMKDSNTYGSSVYLEGNELYVLGKDMARYVLIPDVTVGKTYRITLHTDLTKLQDGVDGADGGTSLGSKGVFDVYVDGVCKASGIENVGSGYATANLPNIDRMFNVSMNTYDDITVSYKNLTLYKDVREEVMAEAALCVGAYTNGNTINLPTTISGFGGYDIVWESSDENAINPVTGVVTKADKAKTVTLTAKVADTNDEYTLVRKFEVSIPDCYETSVAFADNAVTANASQTGAAGKLLLLAVYDNAGTVKVVDTITVGEQNSVSVPATALAAGSYSATVFLWESFTKLVPVCDVKTTSFTKE